MECAWRTHTLRVTGDWTWRYFFLAPTYTLWLDQKELDTRGGPKTRPVLEALVELDTSEDKSSGPEQPDLAQPDANDQGAPDTEQDLKVESPQGEEHAQEKVPQHVPEDDAHHVEARLVSLLGFRPSCNVYVDGKKIASGTVKVENFLNPFLLLFILCCSSIMVYLGPEALRRLLP